MTEKKQINLLSLDFDYFQQMEDKFILAEYPDGNDLSHDISEVIWNLHYRNKKAYDKLMSVKLNKKEFHLACSILQNQKENTLNMIAYSHVHMYSFIEKFRMQYPQADIIVWNIDTHQDYKNENLKPDCENWAGMAIQDFYVTVKWISNDLSPYYVRHPEITSLGTSLEALKDQQFDGIFLCKSEPWYPPHLDTYFSVMVNIIRNHFDRTTIQKGITKEREYLKELS